MNVSDGFWRSSDPSRLRIRTHPFGTHAGDSQVVEPRPPRLTNRANWCARTRSDANDENVISKPLTLTVWLVGALVAATTTRAQALPPPRDGDIRVLYWEIQKRTQVWLTLELQSRDGKPLPTGMNLAFWVEFPGKRPLRPVQTIEIQANAGFMWAPKIELSFLIDGRESISVAPPGLVSLTEGAVWNYLPAEISVEVLARLARAKHIDGNALGLEFELSERQLNALRTFYERTISNDPAGFTK